MFAVKRRARKKVFVADEAASYKRHKDHAEGILYVFTIIVVVCR